MTILVLGANGHTGRFVMEELARRGLKASAATRTGVLVKREGEVETCGQINFADPESLERLMRGADAVINCAGPFFDTAIPAAKAAIRAGIPYLDVTAEQVTVQRLFSELNGPAREAGTIIMPAMAFFGGLADLLASALLGNDEKADSIDIAAGLDSWHPTRGTRETGARNIYERQVVRGGALVPVSDVVPLSQWRFPEPLAEQPVHLVALSEVILMHRHLNARSITSYMNSKPLEDLQNPSTPPPVADDKEGRSTQRFIMDVVVHSDVKVRRAVAEGQDIYAVTAPLAVSACLELMDRAPRGGGVKAPGDLFDARNFLAKLAPDIHVIYHEK